MCVCCVVVKSVLIFFFFFLKQHSCLQTEELIDEFQQKTHWRILLFGAEDAGMEKKNERERERESVRMKFSDTKADKISKQKRQKKKSFGHAADNKDKPHNTAHTHPSTATNQKHFCKKQKHPQTN